MRAYADPRISQAMALVRALSYTQTAEHMLDAERELHDYLAAEFAKVPCIASDPRCPCNDGDTCNYVATEETPAFEVPSAPVEAVPDICGTCDGRGCPTCQPEPEPVAYLHTVRQVGEGASEAPDLALSFTDDYFPLAGIWESIKAEPLYLTTNSARADVDHLNGMVREAVRGLEERDAQIARLTASLAERENKIDRLETEVAKLNAELTKERADTNWLRTNLEGLSGEKDAALRWVEQLRAELQDARKDATVTPEMLRAAQTKSELGIEVCANMSGGYSLITGLYQVMREATNGRPE